MPAGLLKITIQLIKIQSKNSSDIQKNQISIGVIQKVCSLRRGGGEVIKKQTKTSRARGGPSMCLRSF